jgi:hypothetical protein
VSEVTDDVFLGLPGSSFMAMMEDAGTPSLSSYDALRSPFIPELPILAEDATSSSFPLAESFPPLSALVDFSSWPGSTDAMYDPEVDATLSLPPPWSSRLDEEYEYSTTMVDFSSWPESTIAMYDPEADVTLSLPPPLSSRLDEEYEYPSTVPSSFPGLVPFDSDTRGFEWVQGQRESERDSWVDRESYEDGCSMRCPRCCRSASTPPLDPLMSWPQWLYD